MQIQINNYSEMLDFIKRTDVSAVDAVSIFEKCTNKTCIVFCDAVTRQTNLTKESVLKTIDKSFDLKVILFS